MSSWCHRNHLCVAKVSNFDHVALPQQHVARRKIHVSVTVTSNVGHTSSNLPAQIDLLGCTD